jgi:hypothetical protein
MKGKALIALMSVGEMAFGRLFRKKFEMKN